ncbi:carboxypeptidase regulatory-like domain-containing protein [bacterium]|nr:MAG: carboxypeptidase regulatory-like domain-containing protein [bacterium]
MASSLSNRSRSLKRLQVWALLALFGIGAFAFFRRAPHIPISPAPTRSYPTTFITGTVSDERSAELLEGVKVTFQRPSGDRFYAVTDAVGKYRIDGILAGEGSIWAIDYTQPNSRIHYRYPEFDSNGIDVLVPDHGLKRDFRLRRDGAMHGVVRDKSGAPLAGVSVLLQHWDSGFKESVETDAEGRFESIRLPIPAGKQEVTYTVTAVDDRFSQASAKVRVRPHYTPEQGAIALTMLPRAIITGRLMRAGKPLKGAFVEARPLEYDLAGEETKKGELSPDLKVFEAPPFYSSVSDKDGRYRFQVSSPMRYRLSFENPLYETVSNNPDDIVPEATNIKVRPGQTLNVDRALKPYPYGSLKGRLVGYTGQPIPWASIELWGPETTMTMPVGSTDEHGNFNFPRVLPGIYDVCFTLPDKQEGNLKVRAVKVRAHRMATAYLRADTTPPKISLLTKPPSHIRAGKTRFRLRLSDNVGLADVLFKVDADGFSFPEFTLERELKVGSKHADVTAVWNSHSVIDSKHRITLIAVDLAGNQRATQFDARIEGSVYPLRLKDGEANLGKATPAE